MINQIKEDLEKVGFNLLTTKWVDYTKDKREYISYIIITPFSYDNGDIIDVILEKRRKTDKYILTELGDLDGSLSYRYKDNMIPNYLDKVYHYDTVVWNRGCYETKEFDLEDFYKYFWVYIQTILQLVTLLEND